MGDCKVDVSVIEISETAQEFVETRKKGESFIKPNKNVEKFVSKKLPQYFAAFAAHISGFALGCSWFWSATGVPNMASSGEFGVLTKSQATWITSTPMLGALAVGGPLSGFCLSRFGRKRTLMWSSLPHALGWFVIAFSSNVPLILFCRFIIGGVVGMSGQIGPLLISESVEAPFRGLLMCMFEFTICIGTLYIYIIGSSFNWHIQAIAAGIIPIIGFLMLLYVPESPYFLMEKNDVKGSIKSLCWLRGASKRELIEKEIAEVAETVKSRSSNEKLGWREVLKDDTILKPILISMALMTFFQGSYINVILNTVVEIFQSAQSGGESNEDAEYVSTIIIGTIQVFATLIPMTLSDKFGRRVLLLISLTLISLSLIVLGTYFNLKRTYGESSDLMISLGWVPLGALVGYIIASSIGIVPLSWVITAEITPAKAKGLASSITGIYNRIIGFVVIFTFWDLIEYLGSDGTYWLIAGINIVGLIFTYFFVPETRGQTLEQIQTFYKKTEITKM